MAISKWPAGSGSGGSIYWGDAVATLASLPAAGAAVGEFRQTIDTQRVYKWNGAAWVLWLDPLSLASTAALTAHTSDTANPHGVTKSQVGLGSVDNTSDASKPVSTAQATADSAVQAYAIQRANHTGTQTASTITGLATVATSGLKSDVGLGNVDNTSDANKPVSTAQAAADATVLSTAQTYADNKVAALVNSAPTTLDTLKELSDALGGDANFATTVATSLGNRLRVDTAAQGLSGAQKTNAKTNIDLQNVDNTSDATKNAAAAVYTNKDYDGGTASNTSRTTLAKATTATLTALTRKQGNAFYSTDLLRMLLDDGSNLIAAGAGEGTGEINCISNAMALVDTKGWTGVTRVTTGSPLDPAVPTAFSVANTATTESPTSGGYATISSLPSALRGWRLKVEFWYTTPATDVYKVSVYAGTTRLSLSIDSSGATTLPAGNTGKFAAYFDSTTAAAYSVNITRTSGTTGACVITSVIVGPGIITQGASVGAPIAFTPVSPNSSLTFNTGSCNLQYRQVGNFMHISGRFALSASAALPARLNLPYGTINTFAGGSITNVVGKWTRNDATASSHKQGVVIAGSGNTYLEFALDDSATAANPFVSANSNTMFSGTNVVGFDGELIIPIVEWGNGTVVTGPGATTEYAYNSSTTATTDTTSFGNGPDGAFIQAFAPTGTGAVAKRVQFVNPIQVDDVLALEVRDPTTGGWLTATDRFGGFYANDANAVFYGQIIASVSAYQVNVSFYSATGGGGAWSSLGTWKWRVRKSKAATIGMNMANSNDSGFIKPRKGQTVLTVTGTNWTTVRAVGIYYQDQDGNNRFKFNIAGTVSIAIGSVTITISGVTFEATVNQACAVIAAQTSPFTGSAQVIANTSTLTMTGSSSSNAWRVSGDVELASRPTWA